MRIEMPGLCGNKRKLRGGKDQSDIQHTFVTFDFLQSFYVQANIIWVVEIQMSSISAWRYCSRDLGPGDKQRPFVPFSLSSPSLSDLSFLHAFIFPFIFPAPSHSLSHALPFVCLQWHTGPVHLFVESVVVMLCGSCRGQWLQGVLWCNDPCHHLLPPSGQLRGRKGCKVTGQAEMHIRKQNVNGAKLMTGHLLAQIAQEI